MESIAQNENLKYLKIVGLFILMNILLFTFFTKGLGGLKENFVVALYTVAIFFALLAFVIGAVVALFPFNKLPYKKKYLRASLLSNLFIQIVFVCCLVWLAAITNL
jgi:uncharacterized protein involved in response to NO